MLFERSGISDWRDWMAWDWWRPRDPISRREWYIHHFNPLRFQITNQLTICLLMEFPLIGFFKAVSVGTDIKFIMNNMINQTWILHNTCTLYYFCYTQVQWERYRARKIYMSQGYWLLQSKSLGLAVGDFTRPSMERKNYQYSSMYMYCRSISWVLETDGTSDNRMMVLTWIAVVCYSPNFAPKRLLLYFWPPDSQA